MRPPLFWLRSAWCRLVGHQWRTATSLFYTHRWCKRCGREIFEPPTHHNCRCADRPRGPA